jgi:hypothetical protein
MEGLAVTGLNLLDFLQSIHLVIHFLRVAVSPFLRVAWFKEGQISWLNGQ